MRDIRLPMALGFGFLTLAGLATAAAGLVTMASSPNVCWGPCLDEYFCGGLAMGIGGLGMVGFRRRAHVLQCQ